jgi:hypothetical protein
MVFLQLAIKYLSLWHYMIFAGVIVFWLLMVLLTILFRKKTILLAVLIALDIFLFFTSPLLAYMVTEKFVFQKEITNIQTKQLKFIDRTVVSATFKNNSIKPFKKCEILILAIKKNLKPIARLKYLQKPTIYSITSFDQEIKKEAKLQTSVSQISNKNSFRFRYFAFCRWD